MGSAQSQEPDVVRIDRTEIPDEYKTVGVSSDVVRRVNSQSGDVSSSDASRLRDELAREREEKLRMREEMARLSELQQRKLNTPLSSLPSDIEERKRIFDETVERVQSKFFAYHRENVCSSNEKEIMSCLNVNPGRILKCAHLAETYEKCVNDFHQEVLKGK